MTRAFGRRPPADADTDLDLPVEAEAHFDLPVDPDIGADDVEAARRPASAWPRLEPSLLVAVFAGGVLGGLARYGIEQIAAASPGAVPWDVFFINVGGAFALASLLVILAEVMRPTRYVRAFVGTGFLGAFTTFSSLMVATDQLVSDGRVGPAVGYVVGSLLAGVVAALLGLVMGRALVRHHDRRAVPAGGR